MSNKNKKRDGIVYSTDPDFNYRDNNAAEQDTPEPGRQILYVRKEVRNGKPVIVIRDFIGKPEDLRDLEKRIKNHCGVGGTSKDGDILIQGDLRDKIVAFLQKSGYKTKG